MCWKVLSGKLLGRPWLSRPAMNHASAHSGAAALTGAEPLLHSAISPPAVLRRRPQVGFSRRMSRLPSSPSKHTNHPHSCELYLVLSYDCHPPASPPHSTASTAGTCWHPICLGVLFMWSVIQNSLPSHLRLYIIVLSPNTELNAICLKMECDFRIGNKRKGRVNSQSLNFFLSHYTHESKTFEPWIHWWPQTPVCPSPLN